MNFYYTKIMTSTLLQIVVVWHNAAYRTASREVYPRVCRPTYCGLGRMTRQCVGRIDTADIPEYNENIRWANPERSRWRVRVFDSSKFDVWQRLTHRPSVQIIHVVVHQVWRRFWWVIRTLLLVISLRVSVRTLTEVAAYIALDEYQCQ